MEILGFTVFISVVAVAVSIAMTVKFFQATEDIKKIRESVCVEAQVVPIEKEVPTKKEVIILIIAILVILML